VGHCLTMPLGFNGELAVVSILLFFTLFVFFWLLSLYV